VLSITIAPQWRRRGLGRALVNEVVTFFRNHDAKWIGALIDEENTASRELFSCFGFKSAKRMEGYYESGQTMLRYQVDY
jgi:ribosomal protein S18 acetylase RimI-like enzyme